MDVAAIQANSIDLPLNGIRKACDELSKTPNPVDSVSLSQAALTQSQQHIAYSLDIKTQKIRDEIAKLAIDIIG